MLLCCVCVLHCYCCCRVAAFSVDCDNRASETVNSVLLTSTVVSDCLLIGRQSSVLILDRSRSCIKRSSCTYHAAYCTAEARLPGHILLAPSLLVATCHSVTALDNSCLSASSAFFADWHQLAIRHLNFTSTRSHADYVAQADSCVLVHSRCHLGKRTSAKSPYASHALSAVVQLEVRQPNRYGCHVG